MRQRLTNADDAKDAARRLSEMLSTHGEWFYTQAAQASKPLAQTHTSAQSWTNAQASTGAQSLTIAQRQSECEFHVSHQQLLFTCWGQAGAQAWRVVAWEWTGAKLLLEAKRRLGAESALLELVPRAPASVINEMVSTNRRALCERLAHLAREQFLSAKIERIGLSAGARRGQPGRYARIHLRRRQERIAVTGFVTPCEPGEVDAMLSSTLLWFTRTRENSVDGHARKLCFILPSRMIEAAQQRLALLRADLRRVIHLYQVDDAWQELTPVACPALAELWEQKLPRLPVFTEKPLSEWATRLIAQAPEAIDVIRARHGETLRFHGLPFARVRRVMNHEQVWFGAEGPRTRRLLEESTQPELNKLVEELKEHRRAEAADYRQALYRASPEAWLESILRRDITRLDPGLVIAPLHAQFRTSQGGTRAGTRPVDLLALRRDGRLAVIELKVSEDRAHVLQGADYWRRVEAQRRHGHIARARLFGDAHIEDAPPLVYLVAPMLRFHMAFHTLAQSITPEIKIYTFAINEDWRTGVRVMQRQRAN